MININNTLYIEDGSKIFIKDLDFFKRCFHACFIKTFIYICGLILKKNMKFKSSKKRQKIVATTLFLFLMFNYSWSQAISFEIKNNSPYPESEIYVAIVGRNATQNVFVDLKTGTQNPMDVSYNTINGYADCFIKLSDIPNKKVALNKIFGCRVFISVGSQMYLKFFGPNGGYAGPNPDNPSDPNNNILHEFIELSYNDIGIWTNTTRVDSYHYPMGIELYGSTPYQKTGELKTHSQIGSDFIAEAPIEFQGCYYPSTGKIRFPAKTTAFSSTGEYKDYMKPYIDAIWEKYKNEDLIFNTGERGIYKGRVINEQLVMVSQDDFYWQGLKGIVDRRPTTVEAFEGRGPLNQTINEVDNLIDTYVQARICAAINRHAIDVTTPNVGFQDFMDPRRYYLEFPYNFYAKFWHEPSVSVNGFSYGFSYDDVADQSSTLFTTTPSKLIMTFGGFTTEPLGIVSNKIGDANLFSIYPNPVVSELNVTNKTNQTIDKIEIIDTLGRKVLEQKNTAPKVDVQKLAKGMYLIQVTSEGKTYTDKFIKK